MRKATFLKYAVCLLFLLKLHSAEAQQTTTTGAIRPSLSVLNGGWNRVSEKWLVGQGRTKLQPQFRLYYDGYFTMVGQDSTGAWRSTFGGTYEIEGNIYKEKMLYSSFPELNGYVHWQEYEVRGDTLIFKTKNKVIDPQGVDVTVSSSGRKREIICVRAKR
jgi:hypothetical protein